MYNRFWGFKQKPFKLVPNPEFLFLSATHEEALAHLKFTLSEGEGFLMITGEVGTGKSTLCRAFLKEIDSDSDVACAYIFNPKLNALQLLKSINTEFGISDDAATPHELIEILNTFLIENKAADQRVVIIIDEAQNLSVEALEQVRLLSNLETTRDKLLQIVLVGQPELAKMIDSFELRQLGQRISLACNLKPLSYDETRQYIQHRLNVASVKPQMPFAKGAVKAIFGFAGGVPRLINTACDRMLLAACLKEQTMITPRLAADIISELTHRGRPQPPGVPWPKVGIAAAAVLLLAVAASWVYLEKDRLGRFFGGAPAVQVAKPEPSDKPEATDALAESSAASPEPSEVEVNASQASTNAAAVFEETLVPLDELIDALIETDTRRRAVIDVLRRWGLASRGDMDLDGVDDADYFQLVTERHGLLVHSIANDLDELDRLDLPAIVRLDLAGRNAIIYASLIGIQDGHYLLSSHDTGAYAKVGASELEAIWGGRAVVPWKNYLGYRGVIPGGAPRASIVVLKQLLWELGHSNLTINDHYDELTRNAVREIQAKNGLMVDGMVGDLTKIVLYNEKQGLPIPHLQR